MPINRTTDDVELYAKDWGTGRPFVLVHGWPLNADMWDYVAHELVEQGFRVVAYDRRGFGRSSQPGGGYDYDTMSDDLAAVIDGLGLSDVTLVGFSMGGGEVARYMSRHGGKGVSRAILVSAVTPYLLKDNSNPDGVDGSTFDGFIAELKKDRPGFLETFGKQFYGVGLLDWSVSSAYLEWTKQMALQASLRSTIKCVDAFGRTDFRGDMAAFKVPTLVIHGTSDSTVPFEISGKRAAEMITGAELKAYDGAPHGLHYTEQDRLVADLADFVR
ncbi:alpha/beta fold hydrolase [Jiella pacifica]|uniref:Alpha/beta fold hydrolase n=1 Tax=Jiella pacifica TaxID=2696469 RepID=A0A6N9T1H7_9HYPH|nr:alpha/beta hydrolase [Jiella pacifica]NDW05213.1 alpha/beta fold hydrolase [Jiella pacifica]